MGKSQETFRKKELEKKRIKKRNDKADKMAERKANTTKGKSFEDMLAYVDENGNITSTPPDIKKRREINLEEIRIDAQRHIESPEEKVRTGKVMSFNTSKGYGFIRDQKTQESFFVHVNSLKAPIQENDKVTFELEQGPKGMQAVSVTIIA